MPLAIIGMHMGFYEKLPTLFPHNPEAQSWFVGDDEGIRTTVMRNSSLQGAYFIIAARAVDLDCAAMSGFNADKLNETFFKGTSVRVNFVCSIGYRDTSKLHPQEPRLSFDEVCTIV